MQCPEFEQRLQLAADLREDPPVDVEFDLHAALCADCSAKREWFVALSKMSGALRRSTLEGDSLAASYDRRRLIRETCSRTAPQKVVLASALDDSEGIAAPLVGSAIVELPRRRSRLLLAGSGLAVAASIALFVTLAFLPSSQPVGGVAVEVALAVPETTTPETKAPEAVSVPAPTVDDTPPVAPAPVGPRFVLTGSEGPLSLEQLRERLSALPSDPSMTGSLRPITSSFGVAWETLRSALPTGHGGADPPLDQADVRDRAGRRRLNSEASVPLCASALRVPVVPSLSLGRAAPAPRHSFRAAAVAFLPRTA